MLSRKKRRWKRRLKKMRGYLGKRISGEISEACETLHLSTNRPTKNRRVVIWDFVYNWQNWIKIKNSKVRGEIRFATPAANANDFPTKTVRVGDPTEQKLWLTGTWKSRSQPGGRRRKWLDPEKNRDLLLSIKPPSKCKTRQNIKLRSRKYDTNIWPGLYISKEIVGYVTRDYRDQIRDNTPGQSGHGRRWLFIRKDCD